MGMRIMIRMLIRRTHEIFKKKFEKKAHSKRSSIEEKKENDLTVQQVLFALWTIEITNLG